MSQFRASRRRLRRQIHGCLLLEATGAGIEQTRQRALLRKGVRQRQLGQRHEECGLLISIIIREGRLSSFDVFLIGRNPICRDRGLRLSQAQRPFTDKPVQSTLEPILGVRVPRLRVEELWP